MKVNLLNVSIDNISTSECLTTVREWLNAPGKHYIVTPNPEFVVYAQQDANFREILNRADLAIADGIGLIWAARLLGLPLAERITGSDFAAKLIEEAARQGKSIFFLGGRSGVAQKSADRFKTQFPSLKIAGVAEGDSSAKGDHQIRKTLSKHDISLLLVAYGHPRQEYWIKRNLPEVNAQIMIGVGGAFDYWSGRVARAPKWLRQLGLEWLYRLISEPWRLRRQLALPVFVWLVLKEKLGF